MRRQISAVWAHSWRPSTIWAGPRLGEVTSFAQPAGPYAAGDEVTVTATLDPQGVGWPVQLPDGWTRTSATTATYVVRFDHVSCTPVTPADPTVTQATCTDGAVTEPTIVLPEVSGVTFSIDPSDLGDGSQDREVAVCVGGVVAVPTLALVDTDGITSTADPAGPYAPGATVTVTAMLDPAGVAWPDQLPAGWTRASDTTATYTVGFDRVSCLPVVPVAPTVTQATCLIGAVTATVDDGFGWGTITPPWTRVDDTTATLPLLLEGASCDEVAPVAPAVTEAVCSRGVVSAPTLAVVDTAGVTDAVDPPGPYSPGQTVTVTATLDPAGVAWPAALPAGWTRASDTPATYVATFDDVACDLGAPVAPTVIQATCTGGEVTQPTIVLPRSYGISYAVDPAPPYDRTSDTQVTVTATALDGYGWEPMPPGGCNWTPTGRPTPSRSSERPIGQPSAARERFSIAGPTAHCWG